MKTIDDYQFYLSMLPFFYELDYSKSPVHEKNRKFLAELEKQTNRKIEERNLAIIYFVRRFCRWMEEEGAKLASGGKTKKGCLNGHPVTGASQFEADSSVRKNFALT